MKGPRFPVGVHEGAFANACQGESADNEADKGAGIRDRVTRREAHVLEGDNAEVACGHYHRYREDAALIK